MPLSIQYRKGKLEDLSKMTISEELSTTNESLEFNVIGMGHEFWIAAEGKVIVGFTVLGRPSPKEFKIMFLEVAASHKSHGVGSSLIRAILAYYPNCEFSVIPFEGTEEFYKRLGFGKVGQWEMRRLSAVARK